MQENNLVNCISIFSQGSRRIHIQLFLQEWNISDGEVYLKTERPALIIIDNKLPDGFGVDFIPFLKNIYPEVRIIMMSGFGMAVMDVTMENGADIFPEKPFSKEELFNAVHQLMNSEMLS